MQSKPELEVIVPEWNAPENIKAFFMLRSGGMSAGAYGDKDGFCGLNLGNHVGDNKYSVRGNRRIVTDMLGAEPKWLSQVHSSEQRITTLKNKPTPNLRLPPVFPALS